jgi:hypothetical protein
MRTVGHVGEWVTPSLHSPCLEDSGDEVDEGGEAFVGLLIPRGNASKGFYTAEPIAKLGWRGELLGFEG